jgi:hypothetical protein
VRGPSVKLTTSLVAPSYWQILYDFLLWCLSTGVTAFYRATGQVMNRDLFLLPSQDAVRNYYRAYND